MVNMFIVRQLFVADDRKELSNGIKYILTWNIHKTLAIAPFNL